MEQNLNVKMPSVMKLTIEYPGNISKYKRGINELKGKRYFLNRILLVLRR